MRVLLLMVALFGLAALFGMSEPAPASTQPVTSDDVQLVSEQMLSDHGETAGKNGNSGQNGKGGKRRTGGYRAGRGGTIR